MIRPANLWGAYHGRVALLNRFHVGLWYNFTLKLFCKVPNFAIKISTEKNHKSGTFFKYGNGCTQNNCRCCWHLSLLRAPCTGKNTLGSWPLYSTFRFGTDASRTLACREEGQSVKWQKYGGKWPKCHANVHSKKQTRYCKLRRGCDSKQLEWCRHQQPGLWGMRPSVPLLNSLAPLCLPDLLHCNKG